MKTRILLLLVAVTMLAIPSYAQFQDRQLLREVPPEDGGGGWYGTTSYDNGQYLDNPCTATYDPVYVNYSAYVEGLQYDAGANRYLLNESTNMGGTYAASGASEADVDYTSPIAVRQYHKVNTPDNFHVVTVINFDPAAQYTYVTVETACGNGMPDSAQ
jgi:hypothetical protein